MLLLFSSLLGCFLIKVEIYKPLIDQLAPEGKLVCWMRKAKRHVAITVKCKFSGCLRWMLFTIQVLPVDYGIGQELVLVTKGADGKLEQEVCYIYIRIMTTYKAESLLHLSMARIHLLFQWRRTPLDTYRGLQEFDMFLYAPKPNKSEWRSFGRFRGLFF